jgi:hypothetical protein
MKVLYSILIAATLAVFALTCSEEIQSVSDVKIRINNHDVVLIYHNGAWNVLL